MNWFTFFRIQGLSARGFLNWVPDEIYLKLLFKAKLGYYPDLNNPHTYNEKLQWLKLYDRKPEYTIMVDKYRVREYIAEKIGEEYLIPLCGGGVYDNPDNIEFDRLPDQFVLKCNHNSGTGMCICKDKAGLDIKKVKAELKRGLKQNYYLGSREWPYKDVPRKIIAEQYLGENIDDYKILCFNGKPKIVEIHKDRFTDRHTHTFYDINWTPTNITQGKTFAGRISRPKTFELMLKFSAILSKDIYHLRVDWYEVDGKLYFGELTFYDGAGFEKFDKPEYDEYLGELIKL